jgi:hypothetical protein
MHDATKPRRVQCPCCGLMSMPRLTPITVAEAEEGLRRCVARGWTADRLLAERAADLDYLTPGMTDWLRKRLAP